MDVIDAKTVVFRGAENEFRCPGETHTISRAVHLARLDAGHAPCAICPHRNDAAVSPRTREDQQRRFRRPERSLVHANGIRGVYRNELTRARMAELGSAVAAVLWEQVPLRSVTVLQKARGVRSGGADDRHRRGPRVVVGQDDRFSSADLAIGLVSALRRSGCAVVDLGTVHRPVVDFAVDHLHADAALIVTGGGCPDDWNGLDVVGKMAVTWSHDGRLSSLERRLDEPLGRPTRAAGPYRTMLLLDAYAAGLLHRFHALRPLRVGIISANSVTRTVLQRLSPQLPCRFSLAPSPIPFGEDEHPPERIVDQLADLVRRDHLDLGMLIASDGRACFAMDECGEVLGTETVLRALAEVGEYERSPSAPVIAPKSLSETARALAVHPVGEGGSEERLLNAFHELQAGLATDGRGRYWLRDAAANSDALLTLARLLQFFSLSDRPASSLAAGAPASAKTCPPTPDSPR